MTDVVYDRSLKILSVSPSTWTATPLTQWFDDYHIISSIDNPLSSKLNVIDIREYAHQLDEPLTTVKNIFASTALSRLESEKQLSDYSYVMNRAGSDKLGEQRKKLSNDFDVVSRFENKAWFRRTFKDTLRFAPFTFIDINHLVSTKYSELVDVVGSKMVLQHPSLAGSRGTYIVSSEREYQQAILNLQNARDVDGEPIVISRFLDKNLERTVQGCVTATEVLTGPAQAQLIRHPELTADGPGEIQFCGGRITPGLASEAQYDSMQKAMLVVGSALQTAGYRGVFGMDFLIHDSEVFVLETNPRMTATSPLLANLQNTRPFLLYHVLELAQQHYELSDTPQAEQDKSGSFIQIYAQQECEVHFSTGLYNAKLNRIGDGFENGKLIPDNEDQFFIGLKVSPSTTLETGKSIAYVYSLKQLFDDGNNLTQEAHELVSSFREHYIKAL